MSPWFMIITFALGVSVGFVEGVACVFLMIGREAIR